MRPSAIILSPSRDASFYRAAYDAINFIAPGRASRHANASTSITGVIRRLLNRNIFHHLSAAGVPYSGNLTVADFLPIIPAREFETSFYPLSLTHPFYIITSKLQKRMFAKISILIGKFIDQLSNIEVPRMF